MANKMDVQRLIAEIKKRPTLWDMRYAEYKDRTNTPHLWQEIADTLGIDVEHCKRKWKNLRDAYRAEVRRTERRLERLKASGQYDAKINTASKWVYFEPMSFINESKRTRYSPPNAAVDSNNSSEDNPLYEPAFHSFCDIKMEPHHTTDEDDDADDDMLFEEFKSVATPQAARRLSNSISIANAVEDEVKHKVAGPSDKCTKCADDQVNFLENLEREEESLIQSTRQDITRANSTGHVGDADYNFLVSFLPQMKKMSELQNLQFRAKMSELLLNIMTPTPPPPVLALPPNPQILALPPLTQAPTSQHNVMSISTTTPGEGIIHCMPALQQQRQENQQEQQQRQENQQQQQQRYQQRQPEVMMDAEQIDNSACGVSVVTTSSSNWK